MSLQFEWDPAKADKNLKKHGVTFEEATTAFADPLSLTIADPGHSVGEHRFILLGRSIRGALLVVSHAESKEDGDRIRMISARPADRRERRAYEEG